MRLSRSLAVPLVVSLVSSSTGCATVGQSIGAGVAGAGLVATGTGIVLAAGCSTPDPVDPSIERRGPCLPADTYETAKPAILTGIVLGLIMIGAGVAIYSVSGQPPEKEPPRRPPPPPPAESVEEKPSAEDEPKEPCGAGCY